MGQHLRVFCNIMLWFEVVVLGIPAFIGMVIYYDKFEGDMHILYMIHVGLIVASSIVTILLLHGIVVEQRMDYIVIWLLLKVTYMIVHTGVCIVTIRDYEKMELDPRNVLVRMGVHTLQVVAVAVYLVDLSTV